MPTSFPRARSEKAPSRARSCAALALDPLVDFKPWLRWSAGITGRIARKTGGGTFLQPAITLATVRPPEGWGGTIAFELAASGEPRQRF